MNIEDCLPAELRRAVTAIIPITVGMSGAGVYRVEAGGRAFAVKLSGEDEPLESWRRKLHLLRLAAETGVAPAVVHADEARRAVVSAFVADRSFPALYGEPRTRGAAIERLGSTLRRVHALPLPPDAEAVDPRAVLAATWSALPADVAPPSFVGDAVRRALEMEAPAPARELALCHNDVNPANLVYDGESIVLVDWEHAAPNDPFYDLAAISIFLDMDEETRRRLLAAYDGAPVSALPARFAWNRRVMAVLCGVVFLRLAHDAGHRGAGDETPATTLPLGEFYQRMRTGALTLATAQGRWRYGLAMVKESLAS